MKLKHVILLWSILPAFGQSTLIDSLKAKLNTTKLDTNQVLIYDQLSKALMYSKPLEAFTYSKKGIEIAKSIDYKFGEARSLNRLGSVLRISGNYTRALEMHLASIKICEETNNQDLLARTYNNIGVLYSEQKDAENAIFYFNKTKKIGQDLKSETINQLAFANLGFEYIGLNKLDSALFYTQKANELEVKLDLGKANFLLSNLGEIYRKLKKPQLSLAFYKASLVASKKINDDLTTADNQLKIAEIFKEINQEDSSAFYARKAFALAQKTENPLNIYNSSRFLVNLIENSNPAEAFKIFKVSIAAKDSLFSQEESKKLSQLDLFEKLRQKDIEEAQMASEAARKHNLMLTALAVFICSLLIFVLLRARKQTDSRLLNMIGLVSLLMFFEYLNLLIHPFLERITHHNPVIILILLMLIASLLAPAHHFMSNWLHDRFSHKIIEEPEKVLKKSKHKPLKTK